MLYSVLIVTFTYVTVAFATIMGVKAGPELAGDMGPYLAMEGGEVAPWQWIASHGPKGFAKAGRFCHLQPLAAESDSGFGGQAPRARKERASREGTRGRGRESRY